MKILICDTNSDFVTEAQRTFGDSYGGHQFIYATGDVRAQHLTGTVAYLSPANSLFNYYGGIDRIYAQMFPGLQRAAHIHVKRFGFDTVYKTYMCPVGSAALINVEKDTYVLAAPTMTRSCRLRSTRPVKLAFLAALSVLEKYNTSSDTRRPIETLFVPGLGTGVGGLTPQASVAAIKAAFDIFEADGLGAERTETSRMAFHGKESADTRWNGGIEEGTPN